MKRFYQSILETAVLDGPPEKMGDCARASIASILEIDPAKLPNPHGAGDWGLEWFTALAPYGVAPMWIGNMKAWWKMGFPGFWLATVDVTLDFVDDGRKREDIGADEDVFHNVVMLHDILAHDPTPDSILWTRDFKKDIVHATIFVPIDPKRAVVRR